MNYTRIWVAVVFTLIICLAFAVSANGQEEPFRQIDSPPSLEGGKGLTNTLSAGMYGRGFLGVNFNGLYTNSNLSGLTAREHILVGATSLTYDISDDVEFSAALYALGRGRFFSNIGRSDELDSGLGAAKVAVKYHLPFSSKKSDFAGRMALSIPMGADFTLHPSYPFDTNEYGLELMGLQSFALSPRLTWHLNQGYRWQGLRDDKALKNDLLLNATAFEYKFSPNWIAFTELSSALELDDHIQVFRDRLVLTPGLQFRSSSFFALNLSTNLGLSKSRDDGGLKRAEPWRILFGVSFVTRTYQPDDDHDGIPNISDRDPHTPKGWPVDSHGRPLDSDGDGVPDGTDEEIHSPSGALVNVRGHALDTDGDGVPDGIDREPNTRQGAVVNVQGIALDSDGDGVPDGIDIEPNTPAGLMVDAKGKSLPPMEIELLTKGFLRVHKIYFDVGKAKIKPESYGVLNEIGRIMAKHPDFEIEVCGHTDAQGSDDFNDQLSVDRALNVKEYLVSHYAEIRPENLEIKGFGRRQPLVDNRTEEGRAQNRRVEFVVTNLEQMADRF